MPLHLCLSFEQLGKLSVSSVFVNCATQVGFTAFEVVEKPSEKRISEPPLVQGSFWRNSVVRNQMLFYHRKNKAILMAKPAEQL